MSKATVQNPGGFSVPAPPHHSKSKLFLQHVKRKQLFSIWEGNKMSNPRLESKQQLVKKYREEGDLCEVRMTKADVIRLLEGFG